MNRKTLTNAVSTAAFSLVNILFLLSHFSYWGCACVAAIVLFYVIKINVLGRSRENYGITEWLGTYLGALGIDCIFILALEEKLFETPPQLLEPEESAVITSLVVLGIGSVILRLFHVNGISLSKPQFYIKNILLGVMAVVLSSIFIEWEFNSIIYFVVAIVLFGIAIDAFAQHKSYTTAGFTSAYFILVIFILATSQYGDFAISLVSRMMNYVAFGYAEWYYYVGAALLFLACALHSHILNSESNLAGYDVRVYIWLISASFMMWFLNAFYTPYNPIFLIIYGVVNVVFLFPNHSEKKITFFGFKFSSITLKYAFVLAISLLLPIAFYYGWLLQAVCVLISAIGLCVVGSKHENNKTSKISTVFENDYFWYYLLASCAVYSAVTVFVKSNFAGNYIMIAFAAVLAVFASIALMQTNSLSPKHHYIMQGVVIIAACLFMLFGTNQAEFVFEIGFDTEKLEGVEYSVITVDVECDGNDFDGEYYWTSNPDERFEINEDSDTVKIPYQNGCLKIELETEDGVSAEFTRFFFDTSDYFVIDVGDIIELDNKKSSSQYPSYLSQDTTAELGNVIGSRCYGSSLPIATADGFTANYVDPTVSGKVTVIGFWGVWDDDSVEALADLNNIAVNYSGRVSVYAVHTNKDVDRLPGFIKEKYTSSDMIFLFDQGDERYLKMLNSSESHPFVLVLDENGVIVKKFYGNFAYKDIEAAVKNELY